VVKHIRIVLLLGVLTGAGCVTPQAGMKPDIARAASEPRKEALSPPPEVRPSDVNEKNYREKFQELETEIIHGEDNSN